MSPPPTSLDPAALVRAREEAGLDLATAARKAPLSGARGGSGADRLAEFEAGTAAPSFHQLRRLARQYQVPVAAFYRPVVPDPLDREGWLIRGRDASFDAPT